MQVDGVTNGAVKGARAAYELHAPQGQEDYSNGKTIPSHRSRSYASQREPLSNIANRDGNKEGLKPGAPTYSRVESLGKQESGMSRSGSEADSLLDLYRRNNSNSNVEVDNVDPDIPENMYRPEEDDPEGWIHRDKLAKIENEELQVAGINLANARRTMSKTGRRQQSRDGVLEDAKEQNPRSAREEKRQKISSTVAEEKEDAERNNWDLRSPEEIAADDAALTPLYTNPVLRKTGSKIPILTSSPLPIPQERVERDTPLPRKRTMSGSMSPVEAAPGMRIRPRQNSLGSQGLLDDADTATGTPPNGMGTVSKTGSPVKSKTAYSPNSSSPAAATTTASRKTTPNPRKASTTAPKSGLSSPTTNSSSSPWPSAKPGETERPRTAVNRPDIDPPWLATMYKPDPRLPPDQQIIPTHARRQQQAQWDDEGAIPSTYDRNFSPLMVHPQSDDLTNKDPNAAPVLKQPSTPPPAHSPERLVPGSDDHAWPLKPMPSVRSNNSTGRPGTSGSLTGGYSTMPKVTSPLVGLGPQSPRIPSPRVSNVPPQRMHEQKPGDGEGEKEAKGCGGCCVVM